MISPETFEPVEFMSDCLLERSLLIMGLQFGDFEFASGLKANNKLELDFSVVAEQPTVLANVVERWHNFIDKQGITPHYFIGVPYGADGFATYMAKVYDACNPKLIKHPDGSFSYATEEDEQMIKYLGKNAQGYVNEDVGTSGKSAQQVVDIASGVAGILRVFNRGQTGINPGIPSCNAAERRIPAKVSRISKLRRYAS